MDQQVSDTVKGHDIMGMIIQVDQNYQSIQILLFLTSLFIFIAHNITSPHQFNFDLTAAIAKAHPGKIGYDKCSNPKYILSGTNRRGLGVMMGAHLLLIVLIQFV